MNSFKYEIVKKIVAIEERGDWRTEINLIKWNDGEAKVDIRRWHTKKPGQMSKGISLSIDEFRMLKEVIGEIDI